MNLNVIVKSYVQKLRKRSEKELDWFRQQATIADAIEIAATAINHKQKRFSHQRRLKKKALQQAKKALLDNLQSISAVRDFDALFQIIHKCVSPIDGIGSLYIYDTSLRIGAKLGKLPKRVYLHAGTRKGAKALHLEYKKDFLDISEVPESLRQLEPHEIEDVLCIFKDRFKETESLKDVDELAERSWCA